MPVDDITHAYPHVEVDPDRLSGVPTIKGRRVSARAVAELAAVPGGSSTLKQEYDLTAGQINDASRWWKEAQKLAEFADDDDQQTPMHGKQNEKMERRFLFGDPDAR